MISTIIYGFLLAVCTLVAIYFIFIFDSSINIL